MQKQQQHRGKLTLKEITCLLFSAHAENNPKQRVNVKIRHPSLTHLFTAETCFFLDYLALYCKHDSFTLCAFLFGVTLLAATLTMLMPLRFVASTSSYSPLP